MARTFVVTDDLDGSSNAETVTFAFDGVSYEIDLSKKNRTALEKALKPYIAAGRKASSGRAATRGAGRSRRGTSAASHREELAAIRTWARANGWPDLGERGRIPQDVQDAYHAAH